MKRHLLIYNISDNTHQLASSGPRMPDGQMGFTDVDYTLAGFPFTLNSTETMLQARGSSPHKPCTSKFQYNLKKKKQMHVGQTRF